MEGVSGTETVRFEYVTYTARRETCPACREPIPLDLPAQRGTRAHGDGTRRIAYWHLRCVKAGETRPRVP